MPLEAASAHIQQVVGGEQLAAEDLRLRLVSGDVEAQRRLVTPGEGIETIPLTPESFKGPGALSEDLGLVIRSSPFHGHNIFVRRGDVYRIWPTAGADWMPVSAAFLHIQQVVGGEQLAEEDLRLRLVSADVEAQCRLVTPGKGIDLISLTPEDFKGPDGLLFSRVPLLDYHIGFLSRVESLPFHGHNFFVRRADVYRVWPIAGSAEKPPAEQPSKQLPTSRPEGIGQKVWLAVREVWEVWAGGYRWPDREALLRKVRGTIGDDGLSPRTLDKALAYLRHARLIDR
jgi:hypothetical protein